MVGTSEYALNMVQIWCKYGKNIYLRGNPTSLEGKPHQIPPRPILTMQMHRGAVGINDCIIKSYTEYVPVAH